MTDAFSLHARAGIISGRPAVLISLSGLPLTAIPVEDQQAADLWARIARIAWRFWSEDAAAPASSFHELPGASLFDIELDDDTDAILGALVQRTLQKMDGVSIADDIGEETMRHILIEVILCEALQCLMFKYRDETDDAAPGHKTNAHFSK